MPEALLFSQNMTTPTFGDNVRIRSTPETEAVRIAGAPGSVSGFTTPSVTNVEVIGTLQDDYALAVSIDTTGETYWLPPELVEFVDHAPGTELWVSGSRSKSVRTETGEWIGVPLTPAELQAKEIAAATPPSRGRTLAVAVLPILATWLLVSAIWLREAVAADACLDSGGSFDYFQTRCDTAQNHAFVPFMVRHPYLVGIAGTLTVLLAPIAVVRRAFRSPQRTG